MSKWILIEIDDNGKKVALPTEYEKYNDAYGDLEMLEGENPDKCYLIYSNDEWVTECERNA